MSVSAMESALAKGLKGQFWTWPRAEGRNEKNYGSSPVNINSKPVEPPPPKQEKARDWIIVCEMTKLHLSREVIAKAVCEVLKVSRGELCGPRRKHSFVHARHVFFWCCKSWLPRVSYPAIGKFCGDRDHSTVIYGVGMVNRHLDRFQADILAVEAFLKQKQFGVHGGSK